MGEFSMSWVLEEGSYMLEIIHEDNLEFYKEVWSPSLWETPGIECRISSSHWVAASQISIPCVCCSKLTRVLSAS
jgi:hypothetical protein